MVRIYRNTVLTAKRCQGVHQRPTYPSGCPSDSGPDHRASQLSAAPLQMPSGQTVIASHEPRPHARYCYAKR